MKLVGLALCLPAAGLLTAACGGEPRMFAYVVSNESTSSDPGAGKLSAYSVDTARGGFSFVAETAAQNRDVLGAFAGRFLYRAGRVPAAPPAIMEYRIEPQTGALTSMGEVSGNLQTPSQLLVDGDLLLVRSEVTSTGTHGGLFSFAIDERSGALTRLPTTSFPFEPQAAALHPLGSFLYLACFRATDARSGRQTGPGIETYAVRRLAPPDLVATTATEESNIRDMAVVETRGRFLFVDEREEVAVYRMGSDARLDRVASLPFARSESALRLAVEPSEGHLLIAEAGRLSAYAIDGATGRLSLVASTASAGAPRGLVIDPFGRFAYVSSAAPDEVRAYALDGAQMLSPRGVVARGGGALILVLVASS